MSIEKRLASLRRERGMSQLEAAEALGVSRQAVSKWESGTALPSIDNLRAISRLYAVTVDYLVNEEADPSLQSIGPDAPTEPDMSPVPNAPERTTCKRTSIPVICLICLLAAAIAVLTAVALRPAKPPQEPERFEVFEFSDLDRENWSAASVREFPMG